jgi:proteic killer suppression protein
MEISFEDESIEDACRIPKLAKKALGAESAVKLQRRLTELFNAENVSELVAGRPHPLTRDRIGEFAMDLHGGKRIVFRPTTQPPPTKPDGSIDWKSVTKVTITELGDYHD